MSNLKSSITKLISKEAKAENIFPNPELVIDIDDFGQKLKAVTLCIICDNSLLFIKRSEDMPSYKGHVAFFGGHVNDGEDLLSAAKREFEEETSLSSNVLEHLGYLRVVLAKNLKPILPVVFSLNISREEFINQAKSNGEWVDTFWIDFDILNDHSRWRIEDYKYKEKTLKVHYFDLPQSDRLSKTACDSNYLLWGATGRIVYKLTKLYRKSLDID
jgi:8-oxo-dGTP pyrophosphatase MutT (NUDIX family)